MLYIIAGHGGYDPGACVGAYKEHDFNVMIAQSIVKYADKNKCKLLNTDINHYQEQTLNKMTFKPKDMVLEIHMDSYTSESACGGHVIINSRFTPDKYDKKLEELLKEILPGRSETMVKRSDLYNCNVCANRNVNYRLIEVGFITNTRDRNLVLNSHEYIGREICKIFEIEKQEEVKPKPKPETREKDVDVNVKICEEVTIHIDKIMIKN